MPNINLESHIRVAACFLLLAMAYFGFSRDAAIGLLLAGLGGILFPTSHMLGGKDNGDAY